MPYKLIGKKVMHKKNGRWSLKQTATSIPKAKATLRLLYYLENKRRR